MFQCKRETDSRTINTCRSRSCKSKLSRSSSMSGCQTIRERCHAVLRAKASVCHYLEKNNARRITCIHVGKAYNDSNNWFFIDFLTIDSGLVTLDSHRHKQQPLVHDNDMKTSCNRGLYTDGIFVFTKAVGTRDVLRISKEQTWLPIDLASDLVSQERPTSHVKRPESISWLSFINHNQHPNRTHFDAFADGTWISWCPPAWLGKIESVHLVHTCWCCQTPFPKGRLYLNSQSPLLAC